ncbi:MULTISPECIES: short-chain-enoyl-CoA hydratase [Pelosinus]|uniref:Enoyl-CoA hydratase/isomerase n=1 Tax=Pelosinus fermentans B4 TaxID=1149862 RepID=I8RJX9_9FIRM|nr:MULTISPECIES: short-chain-enoyl-CoA hydratase [Pelosinus]EIW20378.1 Enoyl-CoA hydratase/isomerase [Pelosinus fermentans B4]EIW25563.1 Enoyl-CoA hydratase/isomerase [Pelosinus fermentans A11]OAM93285.1 3-hydroxybutyryl-CoA dehydratase [Pelosinus fermentans DSM 17108]SDQ72733.1 enoyl-CoA hydratase [Pelosinus fermentans]
MSQYTNLLFEVKDSIGMITLHRPKALNALNTELLQELSNLLDRIKEDTSIGIVILTGSGEKAFVAGADIAEMQTLTAIEGRNFGKIGQDVFNKLESLPQPVIAAINGFALGGGCELAMACDIRIASEKAKFGQPEVSLGITPGFGGTQRLPRLVGKGRGKELIYTGDIIDAGEAYRIGLVNKVAAPDELMNAAKAMAEKILSRASVAVQLSKAAVNEGLNMDLASGIAYEAEVFGLCFATEDQKEGMTAFVEKRKANFSGK